MGIGHAKGENKTLEAVRQAVSSPLLETTIEGATGVILNIKGGNDMALDEVYEAADLVKEVLDPECNIIFGAGIDEAMNDEVEITIIATGFPGSENILEKKEKAENAEQIKKILQHSTALVQNLMTTILVQQSDLETICNKNQHLKTENQKWQPLQMVLQQEDSKLMILTFHHSLDASENNLLNFENISFYMKCFFRHF